MPNRIIISIHALLTESDGHGPRKTHNLTHFNPRSPHGERPWTSPPFGLPCDFNPRSPHGERPFVTAMTISSWLISIHALLTESDRKYHQIGPIVSV